MKSHGKKMNNFNLLKRLVFACSMLSTQTSNSMSANDLLCHCAPFNKKTREVVEDTIYAPLIALFFKQDLFADLGELDFLKNNLNIKHILKCIDSYLELRTSCNYFEINDKQITRFASNLHNFSILINQVYFALHGYQISDQNEAWMTKINQSRESFLQQPLLENLSPEETDQIINNFLPKIQLFKTYPLDKDAKKAIDFFKHTRHFLIEELGIMHILASIFENDSTDPSLKMALCYDFALICSTH